jgi:uncharacterized protein DUF6152
MEIQRLRVPIWRRFVNQKLLSVFVLAVGLFEVSIPLLAHHGVAGYDLTKTVTVHGTVTKFEWSNPHCVIHMDAKNANGEVQNWTIELAAPSLLTRMGWSKNAMKAGDEITADLHPAQNGAPVGISGTITFQLKIVVNGQPLPTR